MEQLRGSSWWKATSVCLLILLYVAPLFVESNMIFRLATILVSALFATSFNLLLGYTGLVSFGQAAYYAIGAFTIALFMDAYPSFLLGIMVAAVISGVSAWVLGSIAFRASGIYFAILTLALGELVFQFLYKSSWSGGQNGLAGIKVPDFVLFGWEIKLNGMPNYYFIILTMVITSLLILWIIVHSRFGKTLVSIKEDPVRAEFLGVNVRRYRLIAFVISGTFTGIAGALSAPLNSIITADLASWVNSATPIIITLFGGFSYFFGPAIGAFVYELFRFLTSSFSDSSDLFIGIMLLIVILALPNGILGFTAKGKQKANRTKDSAQGANGPKREKKGLSA
ncbi:branched-chain amino acid ABC transporter permease [Brevibacillus choshinensis]|uniref:branched-chain amino acid ABC transporter permease n=1 Tax=Brevibacillus choshinensis TaxID=54911 RepID=UPI002E23201F|nr:branched-chain amino acid ABC transporter permease [Brevibacillus choshinensis]